MTKRILAITLVIFILVFSCGCSKMPFNGDIEFHGITLTIPEKFIRDSTQSTDDFWVFEHNNFSEYILISRQDIDKDVSEAFDSYIEYMQENNNESKLVSFLDNDAVFSTYNKKGDVFCQEILFADDNSFYAVALCGGTEDDFKELSDTIKFIENSNQAPV